MKKYIFGFIFIISLLIISPITAKASTIDQLQAQVNQLTQQINNLQTTLAAVLYSQPVVPAPLAISTASLPSGTVGSSYYASLQASGGTAPYTWSLATGPLPFGLSFSNSTGVISGTPTLSGTATVGFYAQDKNKNEVGPKKFSITIYPRQEPAPVAETITIPTTGVSAAIPGCASTTPPWVKVSSPNGGETFAVGQNVTVKWTSCNVPASNNVFLTVLNSNYQLPTYEWDFFLPVTVSNTGSATIAIPNKNVLGNVFPAQPGQATYSVRVETKLPATIYDNIKDLSDGSITINTIKTPPAETEVRTVPPTTGVVPSVMARPAFLDQKFSVGASGIDVTKLQQNLEIKGCFTRPEGVAYGYYGRLTQQAVETCERKYKVIPAAEVAKLAPQAYLAPSVFSRNLFIGVTGDDVTRLQVFLAERKLLSSSLPRGYFGQATFNAVRELQRQNRLDPVGNVGPQTLKLLNESIVSSEKAPLPAVKLCDKATSGLFTFVPSSANVSGFSANLSSAVSYKVPPIPTNTTYNVQLVYGTSLAYLTNTAGLAKTLYDGSATSYANLSGTVPLSASTAYVAGVKIKKTVTLAGQIPQTSTCVQPLDLTFRASSASGSSGLHKCTPSDDILDGDCDINHLCGSGSLCVQL